MHRFEEDATTYSCIRVRLILAENLKRQIQGVLGYGIGMEDLALMETTEQSA